MQVKKQQLELDTEQWTGSKLGKEYVKAVYCHPASVQSVQSLSHVRLFATPWTAVYVCFIEYAKAFDCVDHNKLWKILTEMGKPDHLTCLLRNLYAG